MNSPRARHPSLPARLLARLGRSLGAWGDPFLLASRRHREASSGAASPEETEAVAAALARLAASETMPREAPSAGDLAPAGELRR